MRATGWRAHSVRGFLSGTVSKKLGLMVTSTKTEEGGRSLFRQSLTLDYPFHFAPPGSRLAAFLVSQDAEFRRSSP